MTEKIILSAYQIDDAIEAAQDALGTWDEIGIRKSYSGRGMYGDECFGIVCPSNFGYAFIAAIAANSELGLDVATMLVKRLSTDSMGYDTIIYFPGVVLGENTVIKGYVLSEGTLIEE